MHFELPGKKKVFLIHSLSAAESNDADPLCKLVSGEINQYHRFCAAVTRSSYFKFEITHPRREPHPCSVEKVFFETTNGVKEAAGKSYWERMTMCYSTNRLYYISRAYKSNQILVYRRHSSDDKIYLENLSFNISLVDESQS